jgi:hypothetical protein
MPLVELSVELLNDRFTAVEMEVLNEALNDSTDRIVGILKSVADEVAGYVEGCRRNPRIPRGESKVPQELVNAALSIARHQLGAALPGMNDIIDDLRVTEYRDARQTLKAAASCEIILDADWAPSANDQTSTSGGLWGGDKKIDFSRF